MRICIVDDTPEHLELLTAWLGSYGYDVVPFSEPQKAVPWLTHHLVDLLVLDLAMPELDGVQVLAALAAAQKTVPTILHSAYIARQDVGQVREAGYRLGAVAVLDKADGLHALVEVIRGVGSALRTKEELT